jgi:iron complex transport system substrate-binding protein
MRVVSLLPSATEIVYALGVEPVGVSHECDHPPAARELPAVNFSRVDPEASSEEIDDQVQAAEREHGGVYGIHVDVLDELDPDLIVTQGICDVCAVDEVVVADAVDEIEADPEVLTTDPHSIDDVLGDIERVGAALGREAQADEVVADLRDRVEAVRERTADLAADERPRTAVLDWLEPPMVAGHWVPELVAFAGGEYGMADPGDRSRPREWADVREYDPEVLVAGPCGFDLEQTRENAGDLRDRPGYDDLAAVEAGRAWALDGHHLLNRPGPRLVETLEVLAGVLHPDRFPAPPESFARPLSELAPRTDA